MWTPAPMARFLLVALDSDLPQLTGALGRYGAMHLVSVVELGPWAAPLSWQEPAVLLPQFASHERRLLALQHTLLLGPTDQEAPEVTLIAPREAAARADRELAMVEADVAELLAREGQVREEGRQLALAAQQLQLFSALPVSLAELRDLHFLYFAAALVPARNLERLRGSLADLPSVLLPIARRDSYTLILAFCARGREDALERSLRSAYAQRADIPAEFAGTPHEALDQVQERQAGLHAEEEDLAQLRGALAARHGATLARIGQAVRTNGLAVGAWQRFGATARTRLVAGWVPVRVAPQLLARLRQITRGRLAADVAAPPASDSAPAAGEAVPTSPAERAEGPQPGNTQPPTLLQNPPFIRPFETLVRTYGTPNYHELDPTPLAGLLFVLMFGIMFGDVGEGAVLAAAGWLLTREVGLRGSRAFGWILLAAGVSAVLFGALYGTVFLSDSVIPALWFRPLQSPTFFIQVVIAFGIGVLTLALALNIAEAARNRRRVELFLGKRGLAGLWFYWALVLAAYAYLVGTPFPGAALAALLGVPLVLMYLEDPVQELFRGGVRRAWPGFQVLAQSAVAVFDTAVRYVSNTVSFIRLAAFAISHAGVGILVLTLAALVRLQAGSLAILVVGNAFVIGLEGLVVFVQALRLDYYEFFTKFLKADGIPFQPFALPGSSRPGPEGGEL